MLEPKIDAGVTPSGGSEQMTSRFGTDEGVTSDAKSGFWPPPFWSVCEKLFASVSSMSQTRARRGRRRSKSTCSTLRPVCA